MYKNNLQWQHSPGLQVLSLDITAVHVACHGYDGLHLSLMMPFVAVLDKLRFLGECLTCLRILDSQLTVSSGQEDLDKDCKMHEIVAG